MSGVTRATGRIRAAAASISASVTRVWVIGIGNSTRRARRPRRKHFQRVDEQNCWLVLSEGRRRPALESLSFVPFVPFVLYLRRFLPRIGELIALVIARHLRLRGNTPR